jgi:hypothetical protein
MKKFQYITQNKLGAPISLSYGEQGKYSRAEESPVAVEKVGAADSGEVCGRDEGLGNCRSAWGGNGWLSGEVLRTGRMFSGLRQ